MNRESESAGQSLCRKNVRENQDWLKETATSLPHGETVHKPNKYTQDTKGSTQNNRELELAGLTKQNCFLHSKLHTVHW